MSDDTLRDDRTRAENGPGDPSTSIGPWRIVKELGRGGQGVVYLAEHAERGTRVALKVLDGLGAQNAGTMARFRREALAASAIRHPGICGVVEAGVESRIPFIAMEYIEGETLARRIAAQREEPSSGSWSIDSAGGPSMAGASTQAASLDRKSVLDAVALLEKAARAVHAAHEAGVIHRDLKPANVMIASGGDPVILDFGLAHHEESDLETLTRTGDLIGTPAYMSPEQLSRKLIRLDRRSDVWSLGVCLYEAVTLQRPFEAPTREGLYQAILTKDPLAASKINPAVSKDLDVVLQTALDKDRDRRYQSALDLAEDLENVRRREPILARPAGPWTKLARWARRNPAVATLTAAVFLALAGGLVVATVLLARVSDEKERADRSAGAERDAKLEADRKRQQAETNLAYAKKGNEVLASVFTGLDPQQEYRTVAELRGALRRNLDQALRDLDGGGLGEPEDVAAMQLALGQSLHGLGGYDEAIPVLEKVVATHTESLGPDDRKTIEGMTALAVCYTAAGRIEDAIELQRDALRRARAALCPDDRLALSCLANLGLAYRAAGRHVEALERFEDLARRVEESGPAGNVEDLKPTVFLASAYQAVGRPERSAELLEELLPRLKALRGPDHPKTLECMNNLAMTRYRLGKPDPELLEDALARARAQLGPDHRCTLMTVNNLADTWRVMGRLDEAIRLFEESLPRARAALGEGDSTVSSFLNNLAQSYRAANEPAKAVSLLEEALAHRKAGLGPDHRATLDIMNAFGSALQAAGEPGKALPVFEEAVDRMRKVLGEDHEVTIITINNLAGACSRLNDDERAIALYEEAAAGVERLRYRHPNAPMIVTNAIAALEGSSKFDRAESWRRRWIDVLRERSTPDPRGVAAQIHGLGRNLLLQRKYEAAEESLRECLAMLEDLDPKTWQIPSARMLLGAALLRRERFELAEPLLLSAHEGLKAHEATLPPRYKIDLAQSVGYLVELYTGTNRPDEAARWNAMKD